MQAQSRNLRVRLTDAGASRGILTRVRPRHQEIGSLQNQGSFFHASLQMTRSDFSSALCRALDVMCFGFCGRETIDEPLQKMVIIGSKQTPPGINTTRIWSSLEIAFPVLSSWLYQRRCWFLSDLTSVTGSAHSTVCDMSPLYILPALTPNCDYTICLETIPIEQRFILVCSFFSKYTTQPCQKE